jgi:hypothetical protein
MNTLEDLIVNSDIFDTIMTRRLAEDIKSVSDDIARLRKIKRLKPYQQEDLEANLEILAALNHVYDYYGGHLE